jgi:ABC-type glycerol-3-phosphate transport system permease component
MIESDGEEATEKWARGLVANFSRPPSGGEVWQHLRETVLADYIANSLLLMLGVAIGTLAIGVSAAWICRMYRFPGRRLFEMGHAAADGHPGLYPDDLTSRNLRRAQFQHP